VAKDAGDVRTGNALIETGVSIRSEKLKVKSEEFLLGWAYENFLLFT